MKSNGIAWRSSVAGMARTEGTGLRRVLQSLQARILSPERTAWYSTSLADDIVPAEALPRLAERIKARR